ncbi:hypothetical protein [Desulfatiglans anilini]|uniref:IS66 family transposase n=1 Tax=Desulfatiglans anilini TaxID=90728 RepID=UPI000404BCB0|nr:hypothetical protein [Desulfatiglans anilini]
MLQDQVEKLLRRVYGRRSEKSHPDQFMFESLLMDVSDQPCVREPLVELPESSLAREAKAKTSKRNHPVNSLRELLPDQWHPLAKPMAAVGYFYRGIT